MNDLNPDPLQDHFEVEISDLSSDGTDAPAPATRRVGPTRLSPRARARRVALVASAFLALAVVILASQAATRNQVVGFVQQFIPTPTPTLAPGADRFYIAADVPWITVALDGQPIALPRIGVDAPLRLARGHHLLIWAAEPFQPQQCSLDIPATPASSCPPHRSGQAGHSRAVGFCHRPARIARHAPRQPAAGADSGDAGGALRLQRYGTAGRDVSYPAARTPAEHLRRWHRPAAAAGDASASVGYRPALSYLSLEPARLADKALFDLRTRL
ncbi:MAG TPA: hypothetical protein VH590_20830 [Ktedonobacterales bacterium]|jgi:hypothetical protein